MKFTGIALIVIGFALLLFAGVSNLVLTPTPDDLTKATVPSSPIFSPAITLVVAAIATVSGVLMLIYGGRGYIEKTPVKPAR